MRRAMSSQLVPSTTISMPILRTCSAAAMATAWRTESSAGYRQEKEARTPSRSRMPSPSPSAQPAPARSCLAYSTSVSMATSGLFQGMPSFSE